MQTAGELMEAYLREHAAYIQSHNQYHRAFGEKFYSEECREDWWNKYRFPAFDELLSSMEISGDTALAFTMNAGTGEKSRRYHLRVSHGEWEIHNWDWFCERCKGTGRYGKQMQFCDGELVVVNQGENCVTCGGSGWRKGLKFLKSAANTA